MSKRYFKRQARKEPPRYLGPLLEKYESGEYPLVKGALTHVEIQHDDWCQIFNGGQCNCNPEIGPYAVEL